MGTIYQVGITNTALGLQVHLPDEECSYCGSEFPAIKIRSHQNECVKRKENREDDQDCKGTKRKLESEMTTRESWLGHEEEQKTESISPRTGAEGDSVVGEHQTRNIHQQNISIKYGSSKYSVGIELERKMGRVMRKLAKMVDKQVDKLVFMVEGKVITGEETMRELVGKVIVVQNV